MFVCNCCNSLSSINLINLGKQPYANKYPLDEDTFNETINSLIIEICENCFTASTKSIASRKVMFEEYFYLSSINKELVEHFHSLSNIIPKGSSLLDIGSNDGILLKPLINKGVKAIGIDPSENVGKIANDNNLETVIGFFDNEKTDYILKYYGKFDYIVASSIFTHVEKSQEFIKNVHKLMNDDSIFILEIEYVKNIIGNIEFERFYFDRPYYFSITGIKKIFSLHNLYIHNIEEIRPHGGSLRFFIKKTKNSHYENKLDIHLQNEKIFFHKVLRENFQNIANNAANKLKEFLVNQKKINRNVIGFGCPARFSTITNFADIDQSLIPYVVDDSPIKQNKFSPGKHIPIVSRQFIEREFKPEIIVVFAYEYFNSIYSFTKRFNAIHYKPVPLKLLES